MQRRKAEQVEKENQSAFSRNPKVPVTAAKTIKNELKGNLTAEKTATKSSQRNVVKQVPDVKKTQGSKPATTTTETNKGEHLVFVLH